MKQAVAWIQDHIAEQMENHVRDRCEYPSCAAARSESEGVPVPKRQFSNGVRHKEGVGKYRFWVDKDSQHVVGMDGHEHGEVLMEQFEVDHAVTGPDGGGGLGCENGETWKGIKEGRE